MKSLILISSALLFSITAFAGSKPYTARSVGWISATETLPGSNGVDNESDWDCAYPGEGESCKLCALGSDDVQAQKVLREVVDAWENNFGIRYDLNEIEVSRYRSKSFPFQACGRLTLSDGVADMNRAVSKLQPKPSASSEISGSSSKATVSTENRASNPGSLRVYGAQ